VRKGGGATNFYQDHHAVTAHRAIIVKGHTEDLSKGIRTSAKSQCRCSRYINPKCFEEFLACEATSPIQHPDMQALLWHP